MANKTQKNLIHKRDQYNSYYGDFRGVDFSSDHTQVHPNRLAYSLNMYKDYQSALGNAIETIPGFRRMFYADDGTVHGIHALDDKNVLVHVGEKLYRWDNYPYSCGVEMQTSVNITRVEESLGTNIKTYYFNAAEMAKENGGVLGKTPIFLKASQGENNWSDRDLIGTAEKAEWFVKSSNIDENSPLFITYKEDTVSEDEALYKTMNDAKSVSFVVGNALYILDGKNYLRYAKKSNSEEFELRDVRGFATIPTRYVGIVPSGDAPNGGKEKEQRNLLSPYFKATYYADGENDTFPLKAEARYTEDIAKDFVVHVYGIRQDTGFTYDKEKNAIVFHENSIPKKPSDAGFSEETYGVVITARYADAPAADAIAKELLGCTLCAIFDNRVFFSGNPDFPNRVWFSMLNDPQFFGTDNWVDDGIGNARVTGMIPVANALAVLKENAMHEGAVYYHSPSIVEGDDVYPKLYTSEQGLAGIGCLGACTNYLDDPVFVSARGLEAIGQLSVRYERAILHRSTLVDAYLTRENLKNAFICEWNRYLLLFVDGKMYMADSRQKYSDGDTVQYEWYYCEGIGVYEGQKMDEKTGSMTGGVFNPASVAVNLSENIFFGTTNGVVCCFNFDKRDVYGEIPPKYYNFDGRTIVSGCATKMDNCGVPHLTKSTVKKSTVVKIKTLPRSSLKVKVRTNRVPYKQIAHVSSAFFTFDDVDFEEFTFVTTAESLFSVREKEKKWVEKQLLLYSDEYCKPFALFYVSSRYFIAGRFKQ